MIANEAPKKIYLYPSDRAGEEYEDEWGTFPWGKDDIEYTRTDALIEKAEMFFTEKFEVEDYNDNIDIDGSPIFNYGRFIEDFKNYMKGGEE